MWSLYSLNDAIAIGIVAYVSQLLGAGDRERAGRGVAFLGVGIGVIGVVGAGLDSRRPTISAGCEGSRGAARRHALLRAVLVGALGVHMVPLTGESIMPSGDSRTPPSWTCAITLNVLLDPFLTAVALLRLGVAGRRGRR
jgi:hypothetical protein